MKQAASHLRDIIALVMPLLENIPDEDAGIKPRADKWSKKEIIGHLTDSACNNQQKFVRTMAQNGLQFAGYDQDIWVASQHYNETSWKDLLQLWQAYNRHIAHIMEYIPETCLNNTIIINNSKPFTLEFIVKDYTEHLKHHLKAILPEAGFLKNTFEMVY